MSHGLPLNDPAPATPVALPPALGWLQRLVTGLNRVIFVLASIALGIAALVLTHSVVVRNVYGDSTEWQEEVTVFLLLGAMFLSTAGVQERRGHIGIDALASVLSPRANHLRQVLVDMLSFAFTAFFAVKCWQLLHEAIVDDLHSTTTWGPPLWIPYGLMASGLSLLAVQVGLQMLAGIIAARPRGAGGPAR